MLPRIEKAAYRGGNKALHREACVQAGRRPDVARLLRIDGLSLLSGCVRSLRQKGAAA